jgi:glutathione S-transferase
MKLYYSDTLNPRKVCAVAQHLQSPVEFIWVELGKGEHRMPAVPRDEPEREGPGAGRW